MNLRLSAAIAAGLLASAVGGAQAHHSTAMFEWGKETPIVGTVEEVEWTQPHVWIWFQVPNKAGGTDRWGIEGMSPSYLNRVGWTKGTLKAGEKITMGVYKLKDGRNGGFIASATWADGHSKRHVPGRPAAAQAAAEGGR